jgi:hypothetical protein
MYWRQVVRLLLGFYFAFAWFGLALKLGFHPVTKAILVAVVLKTRALLSG